MARKNKKKAPVVHLLNPPAEATEGEIRARQVKDAIQTLTAYGGFKNTPQNRMAALEASVTDLGYGMSKTVENANRLDSLGSSVMGMGESSMDKRQSIAPYLRGFFDNNALDSMFMQGGLFRRVAEAPAVDAIAPGWTTDDGVDQDATSKFDRKHELRKKMIDAVRFARAYGRSHILKVTDDDLPLDQPLPPGKHNILALHVFMRREAIAQHWCSDIRSPYFGNVDIWSVVPLRTGVYTPTQAIHASRMLTIHGLDSPLTSVPGFDLGRGLSVPDAYWEEIRDLVAVWGSLATMALEASLPTLSIGEKDTVVSGSSGIGDDSDDGMAAAMQLLKLSRSAWGMTIVNGNDKFSRDNVSFQGIKDVIAALEERVCAVEGLPGVRLFGQAPGGLSTDDKSGRATYTTLVNGIRVDHAEPVLQSIYDTHFGEGDRTINWGDVETLDATQIASIEKMHADRDKVLLDCGAITASEIRARYSGDEVLPNPVVVGPMDVTPVEAPVANETPVDITGGDLPQGLQFEAEKGV